MFLSKNITIGDIEIKKRKYVVINKPFWLKKKGIGFLQKLLSIKKIKNGKKLSTVCEEARCPNIDDCWSHGTATIMLMGSMCTRSCKFCSINTGNPNSYIDFMEPKKVSYFIQKMSINFIVLTSVDRDDLSDSGSGHFYSTVKHIRLHNPYIKVESLIPDFDCNTLFLYNLLLVISNILSQNLETIENFTNSIRDLRAGYWKTLNVLSYFRKKNSISYIKTSLILGFGEIIKQMFFTICDLSKLQLKILTLGQYLQPSFFHIEVKKFLSYKEFNFFKLMGLYKNLVNIISGPLVRSSYRSDRLLKDIV